MIWRDNYTTMVCITIWLSKAAPVRPERVEGMGRRRLVFLGLGFGALSLQASEHYKEDTTS